MHILVLLTDLFDSVGGIQTFNRCFVKVLCEMAKEKNWKITIIVLNDTGKSNVSEQYLSTDIANYIFCSRSKTKLISMFFANLMKTSKIIVGHLNFLPLLSILKFFSLKIEAFLIIFGVDVEKRFSWLYRIGLSNVGKILAISENTKNTFLSNNKFDETKFNLLPCTLLSANVGSLKSRNELSLPSGKMILTVSRLDANEEYKNIDLIIKAFPEVLKIISDAFLVIIGDGTARKKLVEIVKSENLINKVIFAGKITADLLPSYYNTCDAFVLPSTKEGFGIVFLEAMYYAKPCIGVNSGGVSEVIEDGKTGVLVKPKNINILGETIIKLLSDGNLREKMGKAGQKKYEEEFSFEKFRERLEKILCEWV